MKRIISELQRSDKNISDRISIDSRTIKKGDIFFAIGRGHEFVQEAIFKDASFAVIDDSKYYVGDKTILVDNVLETLKNLGHYFFKNSNLKKTIGITGSVGKTTTRSWLTQVLKSKFKTIESIKNYNTIYGIPISMCQIQKDTDYAVLEMGSSNPGEIQRLSEYISPDIGILTNIYESHIGKFANRLLLANEKISIISGMSEGGTLVYHGDSEFCDLIKSEAEKKNIKTLSVGFGKDIDFSIKINNNDVELKTPIGKFNYKVSVNGNHFAYITATVIASLVALNLNPAEYIEHIEALQPIIGRGKILKYNINGTKFDIIDDTYNASPQSMLSSIERLSLYDSTPKIAVIGQMKELGNSEVSYHKLIAEKIRTSNLDKVIFIGDKHLWQTMDCTECFESINKLVVEKIYKMIDNDSVVLLKGSNSIGLNKIIDYINVLQPDI